MTTLEWILGGIMIATLTGIIGKCTGSKGRVPEKECDYKREACTELITTKLDNIDQRLDDVITLIKNGHNSK